jgi:hypothetical protein
MNRYQLYISGDSDNKNFKTEKGENIHGWVTGQRSRRYPLLKMWP